MPWKSIGKPAIQLVIIQKQSIFLCEKHVQELEKLLGEKLEPLTKDRVLSETKYYKPQEFTI